MSDHKRVLICGVIFGYGGLENHFLDLGKLLVENDAEVTFATRVANPEVLNMPVWRECRSKVLTTPFIQRGGRARSDSEGIQSTLELPRPEDRRKLDHIVRWLPQIDASTNHFGKCQPIDLKVDQIILEDSWWSCGISDFQRDEYVGLPPTPTPRCARSQGRNAP